MVEVSNEVHQSEALKLQYQNIKKYGISDQN